MRRIRSPKLRFLYKLFKDNEGEIITNDRICKTLWGRNFDPTRSDDNNIYVHIHRLRQTLNHDEEIKSLSEGYRYKKSWVKENLAKELRECIKKVSAENEKEKKALKLVKEAIALLKE